MAEERNLAAKYAKQIDERFVRDSYATSVLNNNFDFIGVKTVNVYSIPTVPMTDYNRNAGFGTSRYGNPYNLERNIQTMAIKRDRCFTLTIDRLDHDQSEMSMDAGRQLNRQIKEVWIPEFDTYVFRTLAAEATARGNYSTELITKENAYEALLNAMEHMGNKNVPDEGRVAICSYKFANMLMQDPAFIKNGDSSQKMVIKGSVGEVDGCKIVHVPSSRLPAGCAFILTHKVAATGPKQLEEFKTHSKPQGVSGWLIEGRVAYDCFVLNEKADAIFYHGSQPVLRVLSVTTADQGDNSNIRVLVNPEAEKGNSFVYKLGSAATAVTYEQDLSSWTALPASGTIVAKGANAVVTVAEINATTKKAVAVGHSRFKD